jgi:hypothetical protein
MTNRSVTITFKIDPKEYHGVANSPEEIFDLVTAMLRGNADFPENFSISCDGATRDFLNTNNIYYKG